MSANSAPTTIHGFTPISPEALIKKIEDEDRPGVYVSIDADLHEKELAQWVPLSRGAMLSLARTKKDQKAFSYAFRVEMGDMYVLGIPDPHSPDDDRSTMN